MMLGGYVSFLYSQSSDGSRDLEISIIFRCSPWSVVDFVIIFVVTMACSSSFPVLSALVVV